MTSPTRLPERADVVVLGGGAIGVSIAFHLASSGVDVVLLEEHSLGSGSTSKAAGGVRAQFSDTVNVLLGKRSLEVFADFERLYGQPIDLHQVGYLFLLDDAADVEAFTANIALQNSLGVPSRLITPAEAARLSPLIDPSGLLAAAYSPDDGHCAPESVVLGYATAARRHGARLLPHCPAREYTAQPDGGWSITAAAGTIRADTLVCAAGAWSRGIGEAVGVDLPVTPLRRQVLVTEALRDVPAEVISGLPMTIDFSSSFYFHGEGRGLLLGMSDPEQEPGFHLDRDDHWLERLMPTIARRAPRLLDAGISTGWAGLYEMSPDHNGMIGEADAGARFLYATGFSGHGFLMAPAVGEVVRDLYHRRTPEIDVSPLDATRFASDTLRPELNIV